MSPLKYAQCCCGSSPTLSSGITMPHSNGSELFYKSPSKSESCLIVSNSLRSHRLYSPWNSPGQNTGVGSLPISRGSSQPRDRTQVSCIQIINRTRKPFALHVYTLFSWPCPSPRQMPTSISCNPRREGARNEAQQLLAYREKLLCNSCISQSGLTGLTSL